MSALDRNLVKQIADEMEDALAPVAAAHGLTVKIGGGSFDADSFRPKIEFRTGNADEDEFNRYAHFWGLEGQYGATFTSQGRSFVITGCAPRSSKRPIVADELASGKRYKFTDEAVRLALGLKDPS